MSEPLIKDIFALLRVIKSSKLAYDAVLSFANGHRTLAQVAEMLRHLNVSQEAIAAVAEELKLQTPSTPASVAWQTLFRLPEDLAEGDITQFIPGVIVEGINGIGGGSGVGKTWLMLSIVKAILTGQKFLGIHPVTETSNVLYLTPEVGDKAFKKRLRLLGLLPLVSEKKLRCQTAKDGLIRLTDPGLERCLGEWNPIVCLDTLVRYNTATDESNASQSAKMLAPNILQLTKWGAKAVLFNHHSPKASADAEYMTLENMFRGSGDIGAMCDAAWGIQRMKQKLPNGKEWDGAYYSESMRLTRLKVACLKPRDFDAIPDFRIQGRPYIDQRGDFGVLTDDVFASPDQMLIADVRMNPTLSINSLKDKYGMGNERIKRILREAGLEHDGKQWTQIEPQTPSV